MKKTLSILSLAALAAMTACSPYPRINLSTGAVDWGPGRTCDDICRQGVAAFLGAGGFQPIPVTPPYVLPTPIVPPAPSTTNTLVLLP
jgi:hypothetical protein